MSGTTDQRQASQYLSITTTAGDQALQIARIQGREAMSEPFAYELELYANGAGPSCSSLIGTEASVAIKGSDDTVRYIHGVLTRFGVSGAWPDKARTFFRARLEPKLALLAQSGDCRIVQDKTVSDTLNDVCADAGIPKPKVHESATITTRRPYCVQFHETNLAFARRILEEAGVFFWFAHTSNAHTMMLGDSTRAYATPAGNATIAWRADAGSSFEDDAVSDCALELSLQSDDIGVNSWNFEMPSSTLVTRASSGATSRLLHDWDGTYSSVSNGQSLAKLRLAALEARTRLLRMRGALRSLNAGQKFSLSGHPSPELNGSWVVMAIEVEATPEHYQAEVLALPATTVFRPLPVTPKPRIASAQTAIVTGPSGEEIHTDKYGRVKVHFHWDRDGKTDDTSSCWLRVAQGWAGLGFGAYFTPRVGTEVVVGFLDGDPEQPLVIGCVHNAEETVPYALPANKTRSTLKTKSSPDGKAGAANELRFEDKTDAEEVYLRAQKDYTLEVLNDATETITHDRKTTIDNDDTLTVKQARTVTVSEGDETLTIEKGSRTVSVKGDETHTTSGNFTHEVEGDYKLTVGGNLSLTVSGGVTLTVTKALTIKASSVEVNASSGTVTLKAGTSMSLSANTDVSVSATAKFSAKGNAGASVTSPAQLTLQGAMATFKADAMGEVSSGGIMTVKGALVQIN